MTNMTKRLTDLVHSGDDWAIEAGRDEVVAAGDETLKELAALYARLQDWEQRTRWFNLVCDRIERPEFADGLEHYVLNVPAPEPHESAHVALATGLSVLTERDFDEFYGSVSDALRWRAALQAGQESPAPVSREERIQHGVLSMTWDAERPFDAFELERLDGLLAETAVGAMVMAASGPPAHVSRIHLTLRGDIDGKAWLSPLWKRARVHQHLALFVSTDQGLRQISE